MKLNAAIVLVAVAVALTACSGNTSNSTDGGSGGASGGGGAKGVQVTFSGETFGVDGLPFNPSGAQDADPFFVDGWSLAIDEYLVVVGNVRLSPNASKNQDQSQVEAPVAIQAGPFVLDVHKPHGLVGKDGTEPAQELFTWDKLDNGQTFDPSMRYAFSYDVVPATSTATRVNLDTTNDADLQRMVSNGWTKYVRGTATYAGPAAAKTGQFANLPDTIHFTFGWNDATQNLNCANPDFGDGNTPANRGIQPNTSANVVAQITVHVDHLFWDALKIEGTPLRFDPVAAWADASGNLDLNALSSKPLAATFADGSKLPDRGPQASAGISFQSDQADPTQVVLNTNGVTTVNNLADFLAFSAQSQTHLNADGLCYIKGQQASDPYYQPHVQPAH